MTTKTDKFRAVPGGDFWHVEKVATGERVVAMVSMPVAKHEAFMLNLMDRMTQAK